MSKYNCPKCGYPLIKVVKSDWSMLNEEQFRTMKAGDYVCEAGCKGDRGKSGLRYYWERELSNKLLNFDRPDGGI